MRAMAGSPLKRMRKASIRDPVTGELVPFPYMPRVADLPVGWRRFSTAEKVQHLLGMDLTRAAEILMWPLSTRRHGCARGHKRRMGLAVNRATERIQSPPRVRRIPNQKPSPRAPWRDSGSVVASLICWRALRCPCTQLIQVPSQGLGDCREPISRAVLRQSTLQIAIDPIVNLVGEHSSEIWPGVRQT
jgi:hypothetical protein